MPSTGAVISSRPCSNGGFTPGCCSGEFGGGAGVGGGSGTCGNADPRCSFNLTPSISSDNSLKLDCSRMRMISATSLAVSVNGGLQKYSSHARGDSASASKPGLYLFQTTPSRGDSGATESLPSDQSPIRYPGTCRNVVRLCGRFPPALSAP